MATPFSCSMSSVAVQRTAGITVTGKARPARGNVTETGSCLLRRSPKGVELAVLQEKANPDWLVRQRRQIFNTIPPNRLQNFVGRHRDVILHRETWDDLAGQV